MISFNIIFVVGLRSWVVCLFPEDFSFPVLVRIWLGFLYKFGTLSVEASC